jgi:hypothetical protein
MWVLLRHGAARAVAIAQGQSETSMAVEVGSLSVGRCYVTHQREVRKVLEIDGAKLTYVARGKLAFPSWDLEMRRSTTAETFARDVEREVPCDWR